ncbi:hypothetical protein [Rhodococcus sp. A5(2022)]|uniref:hypothetical protein n=1 Tax=Rhodococcus sp. A5(2022) TaxID=3003588 RepID=UPI0022A87FD0|nr:hypothetical protein [Rhodococcus sp. A5(2022)]MCZ1075064.1 hypothetical protein [Rhodococcus sp. A5(2022)]
MSTVADADAWWHAQSAERRMRIFTWLATDHHRRTEVVGQQPLPLPLPAQE